MTWGKWLLVGLVGLTAAFVGVEFGRWSGDITPQPQSSPLAGDAVEQLMDMPFTTIDQNSQKLLAWKGKVLVVNFWATWCPPCREEMPEFSLAQDQYAQNGVQFVGIAIDDAANVGYFSKTVPISYPLLIAPTNVLGLIAKLGNEAQALPFTIIINPDHKLVFRHLGRLHRQDLDRALVKTMN
jgi:thiol-disulfide isomerase/thioredoxin